MRRRFQLDGICLRKSRFRRVWKAWRMQMKGMRGQLRSLWAGWKHIEVLARVDFFPYYFILS